MTRGVARTIARVAVLAAVLAPGPSLQGQIPDTGNANRALTQLAGKLQADSTLPDSLRRLSVADLMELVDNDDFQWLDDPSASLLLHAVAATLHQVPDSLCGKLFLDPENSAFNLAVMISFADSATTDKWAQFIERLVHARSGGSSAGGPVASPEDTRAMLAAILGAMAEADRERMLEIAANPPPTSEDICWSIRFWMDAMARLPATELGPIARGMFARPRAQEAQ